MVHIFLSIGHPEKLRKFAQFRICSGLSPHDAGQIGSALVAVCFEMCNSLPLNRPDAAVIVKLHCNIATFQ
jgi:hypothetical protein